MFQAIFYYKHPLHDSQVLKSLFTVLQQKKIYNDFSQKKAILTR